MEVNRVNRLCRMPLWGGATSALLWGCGLLAALAPASGHAQNRPRLPRARGFAYRPPVNPANPARQNAPRPNVGRAGGNALRAGKDIDPQTWQLLTKMYRPGANYEGVEISNANALTSEETLAGDTRGRTRREYLSPPQLAGDIILNAPNQFYRYLNSEKRLYLALWPVETGDKAARLRALARAGRVHIQVTGEQMVAGRAATQITISSVTGNEEGEASQVISLDKETGIALKTDRYNRAGRLLSSTYMKTITVGAALDEKIFNPGGLPAVNEKVPLFPAGQPAFTSASQARSLVTFTIKEPSQLPPGYVLDGVWVFGQGPRASVLLRYSSGVNHFSLLESPVINPNVTPQSLRPAQMRPRRVIGGLSWRAIAPEGVLNITYTGHLSDADQQALLGSMP